MMKIGFISIVIIQVLSEVHSDDAADLFQVIDDVYSSIMPIGIPDIPLVEDGHKLSKLCDLVSKDFMSKQLTKVSSILKGITAKVVQSALENFSLDNIYVCQIAKKGDTEKVSHLAKEFNKRQEEVNKLRLSFLTALHELTEKGNKSSLPILSCYLKLFTERIVAIYPDKDVKEFVRSGIGYIFEEKTVKAIEKESGKTADSCPMPESTNNPSKFKSVFIAVFSALQSLDNK